MEVTGEDAGFDSIVEYLRQTRGFDFTAYKPTSLMRRVRKRMQAVHLDEFDTYLDYLQVHPEEFSALFNTILINVTSFYRDAEVWEALATTVVPELIAMDRPIRVWSAGCASGQEAYSAAILLAEAIGADGVRDRVKIYATDVDQEALAESRRAIYGAKQLEGLPDPIVAKYFDRTGDLYTFNRDLRRSVIFGRHDLIQDAPISRVDLLLCRNTLMYFNSEAQARIMGRFYFSVNPGAGFLVLGRAEMLFSHAAMFEPIDLKRRIFKTIPKINTRERLLLQGSPGREDAVPLYPNHTRLRDAAFEASPDAQLVLDNAGLLIAANAAARRSFGINDGHLSAPIQNLEVSYQPAELRALIDRARQDRREAANRGVPWEHGGNIRFLDVVVVPLLDDDRTVLGVRVGFHDVTSVKNLQEELSHSKQELETAYEELQSTNEELETTNEELQSTVEELETTNEELQSTNEELETMNEELQSTNEELQTMNDELRNRSTELNSNNAFLEAVFTSLRSAVIVLDASLRIQVWNAGALEMWGVRSDEAQGHTLFNLDIGLPVGELHQPLRDILNGASLHHEVTLPATNRRGRAIQCRISLAPLVGDDKKTVTGAILLMEDASAA